MKGSKSMMLVAMVSASVSACDLLYLYVYSAYSLSIRSG